MEAVVQSEIQM
uniref:Uncharacterized protein n=1 Tax=Arundo donax TaxID=35708 RepID=A0A0A9AZS9_ARUDO